MALPGGHYYCLYVIFFDGKTGTFYSRDRKSSRSKRKDPLIGLQRLVKLAEKYEGKAENISIYDHRPGKPPNGQLIWQINRNRTLVNDLKNWEP